MADSIVKINLPSTPIQQSVDQFSRKINNCFQSIASVFSVGVQLFWGASSTNDATQVQPAFDALSYLGYDGASLLNAAAVAALIPVLLADPSKTAAVYSALGTSAPASSVPSGWTYSIDGAGKITVTAPH